MPVSGGKCQQCEPEPDPFCPYCEGIFHRMGAKSADPPMEFCEPSKICYNPVRFPFPLDDQSHTINVSLVEFRL